MPFWAVYLKAWLVPANLRPLLNLEVLMSNTAEDTTNMTSNEDVLIVVSKLKNYIRGAAGFNTSGGVPKTLSDIIRKHCDAAVEKAKLDGRKTVMERDFTA